MTKIRDGRFRATVPEGAVVFLIGTRINRLRRITAWLPVVRGMPRMLAELARDPSLGLLGARTFVSGRTFLVVQYWRDADALMAYASDPAHAHLPAWRAFNAGVRRAGTAVGVFHETYVVGATESVYVQMPEVLAGAAFGSAEVGADHHRARQRLTAP